MLLPRAVGKEEEGEEGEVAGEGSPHDGEAAASSNKPR